MYQQFIKILVESSKDFLIISPIHAFGYEAIVDLFKSHKVRTGYNKVEYFENTPKRLPCRWLTTLPVRKQKQIQKFRQYDNYNAINVDKTKDIPNNYKGAIGVPVSFLEIFDDSEFEIITLLQTPILNGKKIYKRLIIQRK
jgi:hypothetical protein